MEKWETGGKNFIEDCSLLKRVLNSRLHCSFVNVETNSNVVQWKPLNVISLGQTESDNIIRMITISASPSPIKYLTYSDLGLDKIGSI